MNINGQACPEYPHLYLSVSWLILNSVQLELSAKQNALDLSEKSINLLLHFLHTLVLTKYLLFLIFTQHLLRSLKDLALFFLNMMIKHIA